MSIELEMDYQIEIHIDLETGKYSFTVYVHDEDTDEQIPIVKSSTCFINKKEVLLNLPSHTEIFKLINHRYRLLTIYTYDSGKFFKFYLNKKRTSREWDDIVRIEDNSDSYCKEDFVYVYPELEYLLPKTEEEVFK